MLLEVSQMFSQHSHPIESCLRSVREGLTRDTTPRLRVFPASMAGEELAAVLGSLPHVRASLRGNH